MNAPKAQSSGILSPAWFAYPILQKEKKRKKTWIMYFAYNTLEFTNIPFIIKRNAESIVKQWHNISRWETIPKKILFLEWRVFYSQLRPIFTTESLSSWNHFRQPRFLSQPEKLVWETNNMLHKQSPEKNKNRQKLSCWSKGVIYNYTLRIYES